jgi:hypothetical protein
LAFLAHKFFFQDYKNIASRSLNKTSFPSVNLESLTEQHACPRVPLPAQKPCLNDVTLIEAAELIEIYEPPVDQITSVQVQHVQSFKRKFDIATATEITPAKSMKIIYRKNTTNLPENTTISPAHSSEIQQTSNTQFHLNVVNPNFEIFKVESMHQPAFETVSNITKFPIKNPDNATVQNVSKAETMETQIRSQIVDSSLSNAALSAEQNLEAVSKILTTVRQSKATQPAIEPHVEVGTEKKSSSSSIMSQSTEVSQKPQKKLVALFEVTPEQLLELQENFKVETTQILNGDVANDEAGK